LFLSGGGGKGSGKGQAPIGKRPRQSLLCQGASQGTWAAAKELFAKRTGKNLDHKTDPCPKRATTAVRGKEMYRGKIPYVLRKEEK